MVATMSDENAKVETNESEDLNETPQRQTAMVVLSLIIVGIVLGVSLVRGPTIFCPRGDDLVSANSSTQALCGLPPELEDRLAQEEARIQQEEAPNVTGGAQSAEEAEQPRADDEAYLEQLRAVLELRSELEGQQRGLLGLFSLKNLSFLEPYLTNLAGVLLYILSVARQKKRAWNFRGHLGGHAFRVAQSMAYLFLILWAWPAIGSQKVVTDRLGPHVLGFLVGLYILRVERVMRSLGERFEDILASALPMALDYEAPGDKAGKKLRTTVKLEDLETQWEALRPQVADPGAQAHVDQRIAAIRKARAEEDEPEADRLSRELFPIFEEVKRRAGEVLVPIDELLDR